MGWDGMDGLDGIRVGWGKEHLTVLKSFLGDTIIDRGELKIPENGEPSILADQSLKWEIGIHLTISPQKSNVWEAVEHHP